VLEDLLLSIKYYYKYTLDYLFIVKLLDIYKRKYKKLNIIIL